VHTTHKLIERIFISTISFALIFSLLTPSFLTFYHATYTHVELSCNELGLAHFHTPEIDCEFQNTHYIPSFYEGIIFFELIPLKWVNKNPSYLYQYTGIKQRHMYSLRAPPTAA
jgi:hypothetical protein